MRIATLCFLLFYTAISYGQDTTTVLQSSPDSLSHSARKAVLLSVVAPGTGQIYNKKYWKAPIVWAGMGAAVYSIIENNKNYQHYLTLLIAEQDDDPVTINDSGYTEQQLDEFQDIYHKWRDRSYAILAGVYVLQLIDASVDAHLFYFDVSDDLSLAWQPTVLVSNTTFAGLKLSLNF